MFLIAATEEFSRKEVDRWSGKCKFNTNVNGNRSAKYAKESKANRPDILVILFMIKVGSEDHSYVCCISIQDQCKYQEKNG